MYDIKYEKLSYTFHYQNQISELLFQYDNALHKPNLEFHNHKYIGKEIIQTNVPNLREIFEEIIDIYVFQ